MTLTVHAPHPALEGLLGAAVGYDERPDPRAVHFGVPGPSATVIIALDDGLDVGWAGETGHDRYGVLAAGLHLRPSLIRTHGRQVGIQLDVTPAGARALLGIPIGELASSLVAAGDLPRPLSAALHDRLATNPTWEARMAALEGELLRRAGDRGSGGEIPAPLAEAWHVLHRTGGGVRVTDLAAHVGWSRRQLTARFTAEFGIGPKQAARLIRFAAARHLAGNGHPLADVAARTGYADQAHLTRDWHELAGRTPTADLAEDFPILQAADGDRGPDWAP